MTAGRDMKAGEEVGRGVQGVGVKDSCDSFFNYDDQWFEMTAGHDMRAGEEVGRGCRV